MDKIRVRNNNNDRNFSYIFLNYPKLQLPSDTESHKLFLHTNYKQSIATGLICMNGNTCL